MSKKQTIGLLLVTVGVGALAYLYNRYYKEIQEQKTTTK